MLGMKYLRENVGCFDIQKKMARIQVISSIESLQKKREHVFCWVHSKTMQGIFCEMKNVSYDLELAKQVFCHYPNCLTEKLSPLYFLRVIYFLQDDFFTYSLSKCSNYPLFIFLCPKIESKQSKKPNTFNYQNNICEILAMSHIFF